MARRIGLIPALHLVIGVATTLFVAAGVGAEGGPGSLIAIAQKAVKGLVAYRDYPLEYPPLGLVHVALPGFLGGTTPGDYQTLFSALGLILALGTAVAVYSLARLGWSVENPTNVLLMFAGLALSCVAVLLWRFDILPAFLTSLGLLAYALRRPGWSGMMLGLGFAAKAYPSFLVPLYAVAQMFERRWRDAAVLVVAAAATIALVFGEIFLVAGRSEFYFVIYERNRGVEIESIGGGIAMLAGALNLSPAHVFVDYGSEQVTSPLLTSLATPMLVFDVLVFLAVVAAALWSFRRDVRETGRVQPMTLVQYSLATVLVGILANKVISPQYVVWLLPFVPLMSARKSLLFLVIVVLTTIEYPLNFASLVHFDLAIALDLNLRNLLFVGLFAWVVWPQRARTPPAQNEATFEIPPSNPAAMPNASSP